LHFRINFYGEIWFSCRYVWKLSYLFVFMCNSSLTLMCFNSPWIGLLRIIEYDFIIAIIVLDLEIIHCDFGGAGGVGCFNWIILDRFLIEYMWFMPSFLLLKWSFFFTRSFFTIDLMSLELMVGLQRKHSDQSLMHLHIACILKLAFNSPRLMLVSLLSLSCVSFLENYVCSSCLHFKVIGD